MIARGKPLRLRASSNSAANSLHRSGRPSGWEADWRRDRPVCLYQTRTHCEVPDSLTEEILGGCGFVALIAEPSMAKTTLLYQVLDGLRDTGRAPIPHR
jgi:hypothetical protein